MTPKQRVIAALRLEIPDKVPTMEIDFQLHRALLGRSLILGKELAGLQGKDKERALRQNAEIYVETAIRLDYSAITVHPPAIECSPGYIPPWSYPDMEDELYVIRLVHKMAGDKFLVAMGIDGTYSIPDGQEYLEFVHPYLKRQTDALKAEGAYVIKHTDGNIMPILDMLVDAGPHAIQSIDPIAGVDIREVKEKYGKQICLMGNVNTIDLQMGSKAEIVRSAAYALQSGMPGGGYIFSSCNSIFEGVPLDNYLTMLSVREKMGIYEPQISE